MLAYCWLDERLIYAPGDDLRALDLDLLHATGQIQEARFISYRAGVAEFEAYRERTLKWLTGDPPKENEDG